MANGSSAGQITQDQRLLGISIMVGATAVFSGLDISAKWLLTSGIPALEVVFMRYLVNFWLLLAVFLPTTGFSLFKTNNLKLEIARAFMLLATTVLNFLAIIWLPLPVTAAIIFTSPLIVTALSVPLLGEQVGMRRWTYILIGFIGILIIIRPGGEAFHWAALLSFGAAFGHALFSIITRKLAEDDSPQTQQIYAVTIAMIFIAPFAFLSWVWPSNIWDWVAFLAMGTSGAVGHFLMSVAHKFAPASTLAPFNYPQIIFLSIGSWLIFNQPPSLGVYIGVPIVIGMGLLLWLRERELSK